MAKFVKVHIQGVFVRQGLHGSPFGMPSGLILCAGRLGKPKNSKTVVGSAALTISRFPDLGTLEILESGNLEAVEGQELQIPKFGKFGSLEILPSLEILRPGKGLQS